jgi:hypothetical protein
VHRHGLLDDQAIGDQLADRLPGVGVADLVDLVGVEPNLALTASEDGSGQALLGCEVDPAWLEENEVSKLIDSSVSVWFLRFVSRDGCRVIVSVACEKLVMSSFAGQRQISSRSSSHRQSAPESRSPSRKVDIPFRSA